MRLVWMLACGAMLFTGCGGGRDCTVEQVMTVSASATMADHTAKAPANEVQFTAGVHYEATEPSCAVPALAQKVTPQWTSAQPEVVSISSAQDATNGVATCLASSDGAVQITATLVSGTQTLTATSSLVCQ